MTRAEREALREYLDVLVDLKVAERVAQIDREALRGPAGVDGANGAPGRDGVDGKNGESGEPGEKGDQGDAGKDGRDGADGAMGLVGSDGKDGAPGERGEKGDTGEGKRGKSGDKGDRGDPGRDGVATRDELHELIKVGVASAVEAIVPEVTEAIRKTLPKVQWRGVFQEGTEYTRGDLVTFGGSAWHCDAELTTENPDGPSKHWRLAVKRGRDGKDGRDAR